MRKALVGAFITVFLLSSALAGTSSLKTTVDQLKTGTYLTTSYSFGFSYNPTASSNNPDLYTSWPQLTTTETQLKQCRVYAAALKFRAPTGAQFPTCAAANPCTLTVEVQPTGTISSYSVVFPDDLRTVTSGTVTDKYIVSGRCVNTPDNIALGCVPGLKSAILIPVSKGGTIDGIIYNLTDNARTPPLWWWTKIRPVISSSGCDADFPSKHSEGLTGTNTYNYCTRDDDPACVGDGGSDIGIYGDGSNCKEKILTPQEIKAQYGQYLYFCDARLKKDDGNGYIEEPSFCNYRCSCSENLGTPGPSCGTCSSFENEINCPADCCEWNCGGTLDGGKYGASASETNCPGWDLTVNTNFASAARWQETNATFQNAQCHYSIRPGNYGNCSTYCGADNQCGGGSSGMGVKPGTNQCDNQCMDSCGEFHTTIDPSPSWVKTNLGIDLVAGQTFRNIPIANMIWSTITTSQPTANDLLTVEAALSKIKTRLRNNADSQPGTCDTLLGEDGDTCPIDCCTLSGCSSQYDPVSRDGCEDLDGDTIKDLGFRGCDINKICKPSCSLSQPGSLDLGSCSGRLAGSDNCTAQCHQRELKTLQMKVYDRDPEDQSNRRSLKTGDVWAIPSCKAGFFEIVIPYPVFCDDSNKGSNLWGSVSSGPCYINFTAINPEGGPMPLVSGKAENSNTTSYRIRATDIKYKKLRNAKAIGDYSTQDYLWATAAQLQSGVDGLWYSVITTSEGNPIMFPSGVATGTIRLETSVSGFTEIGDPVKYSSNFIEVYWNKAGACSNGEYCRASYPEFCTSSPPCVCDSSSFKCVEFSRGPIDPRLFTSKDAAFCCKELRDNSGAGCTLYDAVTFKIPLDDYVFRGSGTTPGACHGSEVGTGCQTTGDKFCNSRAYGYNPPSAGNPTTPRNYLTSCRTYNLGITQNGGPTLNPPYDVPTFSLPGSDKVRCIAGQPDCEVQANSTYEDFTSTTKSLVYTGDNAQLVVPDISFTVYGGAVSGFMNVSLSQGTKNLNATLAFEVPEAFARLCTVGEQCRNDEDCTPDVTCGSVGSGDSKATYCDLSTKTCKCVCDSNPFCDTLRPGIPETTLNCKSTCCTNVAGTAAGPINKDTGLCDFNCAPTMDATEKFPDDWCRDKKPNEFGTLCTVSPTGKNCVYSCGNGVCDVAAGENYTNCAKDCCARDTMKDPTKNNYLPYTINASTQYPLCVEQCLQQSYLLPDEKIEAQSCIGKMPGSDNCDITCMPKQPKLTPVLFSTSGTNRYENLCAACPAGSEGSCSKETFQTDIGITSNLMYCTTYPTGVKMTERVDCAGGCSLSLNNRVFNITNSDIVCIEYSLQSLSMHTYSKQNVKGQVKPYCTQYAICPKTIIPQITVGKVGASDLRIVVPVSLEAVPYSTQPTDPFEFNIQSCPSGCTCKLGTPCNQDSDCALYQGTVPMYCELGKCISKCGNGVCDSFENSDICPQDCCEPNPAKPGKYFVYNRTGYCTYSCGAPNNECIEHVIETDYSEEGKTFACDAFCTSSEKSLILSTYVQTCMAVTGTCNATGERQLNKTTDMSVYLVEGDDDLLVRFGLKMKEPSGTEKTIYEPEGLKTSLSINGKPYVPASGTNPILGLNDGSWYVPMSENQTGTYKFSVNATHPAYLDTYLEFPVYVSKLQASTIELSDTVNGVKKNCFYRTLKGSQNCGVGTVWVNVSSRDLQTGSSLQGTATCTYDDKGATKTFNAQLDQWTSVDATGFDVGIKRITCDVRVPNYMPASVSSTFTVRGVITNATVEMPPEITPATPISLVIRGITDEKGVPILSPSFAWLVVNYPETGDITKFCESQTCPEGLPGSVSSGVQTIILQIKKIIPYLGELYDPLTKDYAVTVKEAISYSLRITPKSKSVFMTGGKAEFVASVQNDGNKPVNITLTLLANETVANWTSFSSQNRTILPGRSFDQKITFQVPAIPVGSYLFNLSSLEASQGMVRSIEGEIKVVNQTIRNVSLSTTTNLTMTLLSNATVKVALTLSNDGNVDETFDLSIQGSGARIASLNASKVEMKAGELTEVELRIDADVGLHEFRACAKSSVDPSAESCLPALITVLQERIDILVPDSVEAVQGDNYTLPIEFKGFGRALLILEGDSVLTSWISDVPNQVDAPSKLDLSFVPDRKGNYTLSITLLLSSGKTVIKQVEVIVTPPELEVKLTESLDKVQTTLDGVDRRITQLKNQGVEAVYVEALMLEIERKRADIIDLLQKGDYETAKGILAELENLVKQAEQNSSLALRTGVAEQGLNVVPLAIGVIAILVGIAGLYVFGMRDNASTVKPATTARQLPFSQAPSRVGPAGRYMYGPQYPQQPPRVM